MSNNQKTAEANISSHLPRMAAKLPDKTAIMFPVKREYASWTFKTLNETCDSYAQVMKAHGVTKGQKALLMLTPGPDLVAVAFALFKMGVLPVMLDPGMGIPNMMRCIEHVAPDVFIGIPKAQMARLFYRKYFKSVKHYFTAAGWFFGCTCLSKEAGNYSEAFPVTPVEEDETAAILFTSGSTGPAKGVIYQHSMFQQQVKALDELFHFKPDEIDLTGYPLFALFDVALGLTSIVPKLDPSSPAGCDPAVLAATINEFSVTTCQGSPAIWRRVCQYCKEDGITLDSLKRVITFGAPISVDLLEALRSIMPEDSDVFTPYGATESLPVALVSGNQVLKETAEKTIEGAGTCVGKPVKNIEVKIIKITDEAIESFDPSIVLPDGEVGEIAVYGKVVTQAYYDEDEANKLAKMTDPRGRVWHRMGDLGYFDEQHRLWFCGRKKHRVETAEGTLFPVQAEGMANHHPHVYRSALVGVGKPGAQTPVLIVEPKEGAYPEDENKEKLLSRQILARFDDHPKFSQIKTLYFYDHFPVDPRHNVKIHREELAEWASQQ